MALPREAGEINNINALGICLGKNGLIELQGVSSQLPKRTHPFVERESAPQDPRGDAAKQSHFLLVLQKSLRRNTHAYVVRKRDPAKPS